MSGEQPTGQDTPGASEVTTPEAAQVQAAPTDATTQGAEGEKEPAAAKSFTQEELNEIVRKEKAKAEAKAERRVLRTLEKVIPQPVQQPVQRQEDDRPRRDQFASEDEFVDRLTDWKLDQRDRGQRQAAQQQQNVSLAQKTEKLYAEAEKLPGFDREAFDDLPLTPAMAQALADAGDVAPKLMAHLTANPADVDRIAALSPARQAAEIGKLETRLASTPAVKAPRAPAPIEPVGGNGSPIRTLASATNMDDFKALMKKQGSRWVR